MPPCARTVLRPLPNGRNPRNIGFPLKIRKSLSAEEEGLDQRAQLLVGQAVHAHLVDQSILLFLAGDHVFSFSSVHFAQQVVVAFVGLLHAYVFKKRPARFDRCRLASLGQSPLAQMMVEGGLDGASPARAHFSRHALLHFFRKINYLKRP